MAPAAAPTPPSGEDAGDWVDRFVLVFVRESTLWPVLIVLVSHVAAFVAPASIFAFRDGSRGAASLLAALAAGSAWLVHHEWRRRGGLGALTALLAACWLTSAGLAWLAARTGFF